MEFDEPTRRRLATAIRERRAALGLSQEQAARASGGMVSTANLRVFEGAGRATFREKSLIGVARAMSWPPDAIARIAAGEDPLSLEVVTEPTRIAPRAVVGVAGVELATAEQVEDLQRQIDDLRATVATLGTAPTVLRAASGGDLDAVMPDGPRSTSRSRVAPADDA